MKICVLGAGTWGVALAKLLVENENDVTLWSAIEEELDELQKMKIHKNLPGAIIPDGLKYEKDISAALSGVSLVLFVVPSQFIRSVARAVIPYLPKDVIIASATKGIEKGSLMTMTEIIEDEIRVANHRGTYKVVALSGPTHAEEVARGLPTSIVSACEDEDTAMQVARLFANSCMRAYTNRDVRGVEVAGALKNIIALAAGINRGMGHGDNSQAMLMTRGIAEITRMGVAMGCERRTFMGLAGIGDLIVTCTSRHSRNNRCGELVGGGATYEEAREKIGMVVEGYHALEAAMELSQKYSVEMPITRAVNDIMKCGKAPRVAMLELMTRDLRCEIE